MINELVAALPIIGEKEKKAKKKPKGRTEDPQISMAQIAQEEARLQALQASTEAKDEETLESLRDFLGEEK